MNQDKIRKIRTVMRNTIVPESIGERVLFETVDALLTALLEDEKPANVSPPGLVQLDEWARGDEVRNYARFHDITLSAAIKRLVNSGLSHERWLS